jgi:hypothetical protein
VISQVLSPKKKAPTPMPRLSLITPNEPQYGQKGSVACGDRPTRCRSSQRNRRAVVVESGFVRCCQRRADVARRAGRLASALTPTAAPQTPDVARHRGDPLTGSGPRTHLLRKHPSRRLWTEGTGCLLQEPGIPLCSGHRSSDRGEQFPSLEVSKGSHSPGRNSQQTQRTPRPGRCPQARRTCIACRPQNLCSRLVRCQVS